MKKNPILISITAALLLCAVLCTAGCVEAPSDAIVGNWVSETDGSVTYAVFENGGAGFFTADADSVLTLEWKANGDTTYTLIFADGTTKTASVNAEHGLMTMSDGSVLEKQANGLSGAVMESDLWVSGHVGLSKVPCNDKSVQEKKQTPLRTKWEEYPLDA